MAQHGTTQHSMSRLSRTTGWATVPAQLCFSCWAFAYHSTERHDTQHSNSQIVGLGICVCKPFLRCSARWPCTHHSTPQHDAQHSMTGGTSCLAWLGLACRASLNCRACQSYTGHSTAQHSTAHEGKQQNIRQQHKPCKGFRHSAGTALLRFRAC
jgi:hypothetical protein